MEIIRPAQQQDLPAIIALLADDFLGRRREQYERPLPSFYQTAFDRIQADPNQELLVVETADGVIAGFLQLTFIPCLNYRGGLRAQVETVMVKSGLRGQGIGERMIRWAVGRAREKGAVLLQLTTDKRRPRAKKFYERLGFIASHEGMKLHSSESGLGMIEPVDPPSLE